MISVIVTVYNQPAPLDWMLACLARQHCGHPFEVIVCDDGSTSDVLDVVRDAEARWRLDVRYVWQPDRGWRVSRSRNNAIRAAQGEILVFLDADQLIAPDFLGLHARAHAGPPTIAGGPVHRVEIGDAVTSMDEALCRARAYDGPLLASERQERWPGTPHEWMCVIGANFSCTPGAAVRFDEFLIGWGTEDRELSYRLTHAHGYRTVYEPAAISYNLSRSGSRDVRYSSPRIALYLRNLLRFRDLHPDADLTPALELVRHSHLEASTDTWYTAEADHRTPDDILALARRWLATHDVA
jgi:glycosyltransferase involved in cell wall biosynthesis